MKRNAAIVGAALLVLSAFAVWLGGCRRDRWEPDADRLILLVSDDVDFSDPRVTVWLDAAGEEGLHIVPMHDSTYLRPLVDRRRCAGIILADSTHVQASDIVVSTVRAYVASGGHLMLVYDAGTKSMQGFYSGDRSRLSDLAGVDYAFYKTLGAGMIESGEVSGPIRAMDQLGVPPGKYFPFTASNPQASDVPARLTRYQFGNLEYPSFVTSSDYAGEVLLHSRAGVAAGRRSSGKGSVLYVNLPLTLLAQNTDGLPLHAFLKYFADRVLSLPYLLPVPDGVGGITLDWHVDSNAAVPSLQEIGTWSLMRQGPYSIDITAGPDAYRIGDHEGFDVLHNPVSQGLVRHLAALGNEIGSHGGWIHDYFANHIDVDPPAQMEKFLDLNKSALEQVTGKPVVEYSAPNGNQPEWVTHWLEAHGFLAYYFTGDTGMGPTEGYRAGHRAGRDIWAFPILHMDRAASFEEMEAQSIPLPAIQKWLDSVTDFVVSHRQVRLAYFHPPGILPYRRVVEAWLAKTAQLHSQGSFRWYTMAQIANFLNSRKKVKWKFTEHDGTASLEAGAETTLAHMAWKFPADRYGRPEIVHGSAQVLPASDGWIIVAGEGNELKVESKVSKQ